MSKDVRYELKAAVWKRQPYPDCPNGEWVLEISGEIDDCYFVSRHTEPLTTTAHDVPGLPSLYATRSSLSDDEIDELAERWKGKTLNKSIAVAFAKALAAALAKFGTEKGR